MPVHPPSPASRRPVPAPQASRGLPASAPANRHGFGFFLFLVVNAALFVRPADVIPSLLGVEIYQYLILSCLAVSFPAVLEYLGKGSLDSRPIDLFILLMFPIIVVSGMASGGPEDAWTNGLAYFKILVYYLLLVSLVVTPSRLRTFLGFLIVFACGVTILSALDFYKVIQLPRPLHPSGKTAHIDPTRMYGPGIFQDPNDVCILIVTCLLFLLARLADRRGGPLRWLWLGPMGVFIFGFALTQSRGGLLALLASLGILIRLQYGWARAILLGSMGLPVLLVMLGARQTAISHTTNTGQERIQLWNEGLVMFRASPLFGVGLNHYHEHAGQVAHNSYMQAFGELGFLGGMLFLGAVVLAVWGLYRLSRPVAIPGSFQPVKPVLLDPDLRQLWPYLTGALVAYCAGMVTLTLNTLVTTYTFLGLASLFLVMARTQPPTPRDRFDGPLLVRMAGISILFLVCMFIFIRLTFRP